MRLTRAVPFVCLLSALAAQGADPAPAETEAAPAPGKAAAGKPKKLEMGEIDLKGPAAPAKAAPAKKLTPAAAKAAKARAAAEAKAAEAKAAELKAAEAKAAEAKAAELKAAEAKAAEAKAAELRAAEAKAAEAKAAELRAAEARAAEARAAEARAAEARAAELRAAEAKADEAKAAGTLPGWTVRAGLLAGATLLSHRNYLYAPENKVSDFEGAPSLGLSLEGAYRLGALSVGLQVQAFSAGSPAMFGNDLAVPVLVGPRLQYVVGQLRIGASASYVVVPKQVWMSLDGAVGVDVGYKFGALGVRLSSGVLIGSGNYLTGPAGTVSVDRQIYVVPFHAGLFWEL